MKLYFAEDIEPDEKESSTERIGKCFKLNHIKCADGVTTFKGTKKEVRKTSNNSHCSCFNCSRATSIKA